ncbi:CBS domain protein [Natranaerovirga pectinivora]|uniref:CBS domain protein n=1 Tax=Natranaerovirga pectinivora TaxID=682400 RepID=A0A4R3MIT6_9FIRM|nr:CBS domain-containing protein [Natranaerovirga pectinivora]TCT13854.1 CBS domain protein [Natranaerovirga pectinivora]
MKINTIMKKNVFKITPTDSIKMALDKMTELNINGMPVINEEDVLVGMIVKADIYRFLIEPGHYDSCPVEWVMTKKVITANSDEEIVGVGKKLRDNNIIAMPVLENEMVVGIVSIEDILDYYIEK